MIIELLFELDYDGIYSDWIKTADSEEFAFGLIGNEIHRIQSTEDISKVRHFSVLMMCNNRRVLSRDLVRYGVVL